VGAKVKESINHIKEKYGGKIEILSKKDIDKALEVVKMKRKR